jgi:hypothetical protein
MRTLIIGASGNFGARIVRALCRDPGFQLVAASRRGQPVPGAESVATTCLDIEAPDFRATLAASMPQLVIHCVGPFQGQDYRVVRAALAAGAHYIDLADGRDFVADFARENDAAARVARRFACSGASTLPGLSSAVIEHLRTGLSSLDTVQIAISPGQRAARGAATLAAVFSYHGRPLKVWEGGMWQQRWGWMDLTRLRFDVGRRWGAVCDVPDLAVLPARHPSLRSVRFHAALEVGIQHFALWALAALRRAGLPLPMEKWAGSLDCMARLFDRYAGKWGGMLVSITGTAHDGSRLRRTWQLRAPAMDGPEIPCMAAILLARRLAQASDLPAGAHPCMGLLQLDEFQPEFRRWNITTRVTEDSGSLEQ